MNQRNAIVDSIHIFNNNNYIAKKFLFKSLIRIVQTIDSDQLFYQIRKGEKFNYQSKYWLISHMEKSFDLMHPCIINLSGFSIDEPYLYYHCSGEPIHINEINLTDENVQKILIGIASGLSYLLSNGYFFTNFSINSIIFDSKSYPQMIDYINDDDINENCQKYSMVLLKYVEFVQIILSKRVEQDPSIEINENLKLLIERCQQKPSELSFDDFINFFEENSYRTNLSSQQLFTNFSICDKIIFDENKNIECLNSIEEIVFFFLNQKEIQKEDQLFLLNYLPEIYIKYLIPFCSSISENLLRCFYNENISFIMNDWRNINILYSNTNPFKIYKELMKQIDDLVKQKIDIIYGDEKRKDIEYKIDAIRVQAIYFLKEAVKHSQNSIKLNNAKIELAIQYIKGSILPCNLLKALKILESINDVDKKTQISISQMQEKIQLKIHSMPKEKILECISEDQKKIFEEAEKNDIFSLLYVGLAFYTGFNGFPVSKFLSIQCYRRAAQNSPYAMIFLGFLYLNGIFFPQNLNRARKCFKRAADKGCMKAEIIDSILRKHKWRSYLVAFDINDIINGCIQSFLSIIPNDNIAFPKIIYYLEKDINNAYLYLLNLCQYVHPNLLIDKCTFLDSNNTMKWVIQKKKLYSEKVLLSSEKLENIKDVNKQLYIAKSYFNGDNGFSVNYSKATEFFKLAAENGNSEAQWRYAILCLNSIGDELNIEKVKYYLLESAKQNDVKGKLCYALFLHKYEKESNLVEKLLKECCNIGDIESMYYYAMFLESNETEIKRCIEYYQKAADKGHFDSFIRLIDLLIKEYQKELNEPSNQSLFQELYNKYLPLSVGTLNQLLIEKLIKYYDEKEDYKNSNILIRIGLKLNCHLFGIYYADHLLNAKGMESDIKLAKK